MHSFLRSSGTAFTCLKMHWYSGWDTRSSGLLYEKMWVSGYFLPGAVSEGNYIGDFFGIGNTQVLLTGLALLMSAIIIRTVVEGPTWVRWYMLEEHYSRVITKIDATFAQRNIQNLVVHTEQKETDR